MQLGGPGKKKCCQRWVYANLNNPFNPFSKEALGKESSHIPTYSLTTIALAADLYQNPDAWREERDDSNSGLPGVGAPTNRLMQRGVFCGDKLDSLEGPPMYDWGPGNVG